MSALIPIVPENAGWQGLQNLTSGYEIMLLRVLEAILERFKRDADYRFIDTKLDLVTGRDFYPVSDKSEAFRSREVIYTWVQGRGLEAMAGHLKWLSIAGSVEAADRGILSGRIRELLTEVVTTMEELRSYNQGRGFFCMTSGGLPLEIENCKYLRPAEFLMPDSNYSDLFYSKGLFAAAWELGWGGKVTEATTMFRKVLDDIEHQRFRSDRQVFNPAEKSSYERGRCEQEPMMIALGGIALIGSYNQDIDWFGYGARIITRMLDQHVNLDGRLKNLQEYDFIDAVDRAGKPWIDNGAIICVPGHALEFIGMASKCLIKMAKMPQYEALAERCRQIFPPLLLHCFELGFNAAAGGMVKSYDLVSRQPLDQNMPWWCLPETMRAAALLIAMDPDSTWRKRLETVIIRCSNAFAGNYINDQVHMMAYSNRTADGKAASEISITPDADPGYHTGLSIIDMLRVIGKHRMQ